MLEQITREAHRRAYPPYHPTPPLLIHTPTPPRPSTPILSPPPECRLIQASSLIHVFIYYFIGCAWAGERRLLLVRIVINSLKPPFFLYPSLSLDPPPPSTIHHLHGWRHFYLLHMHTDHSCVALLFRLYSTFTRFLYIPNQTTCCTTFLHFFCFHPTCWYIGGQVLMYVQRLRRDKRGFPSDRADSQISNYV